MERLTHEGHGGAEAGFAANYSFPTTAEVAVFASSISGRAPWMIIRDTADPNASADYDDAPIGSLYIWYLAGSVTSFIKSDATTWTEQT